MATSTGRPRAVLRSLLSTAYGACLLVLGYSFEMEPQWATAWPVVAPASWVAAFAALALMLWLASGSWLRFGTLPLAAAAGVFAAAAPWIPGWPGEPTSAFVAVQSTGGALVLAGLLSWSLLSAGAPVPSDFDRLDRKKVRRLRRSRRPVNVPAGSVEPGHRLELETDSPLPVDVRLVEGRGFVGFDALGGPSALPVEPGCVLMAGAEPRTEGLVGEVLHSFQNAYGVTRFEILNRMRNQAIPETLTERWLGGVYVLGVLALSALLLVQRGVFEWVWMLPLMVGAPAFWGLALARARAASIEDAFRHGLHFVRAKDLGRFLDARRFWVDPMLLAAPGRVEALALSHVDGPTLVRWAEATLKDDPTPELLSLQAVRARSGHPAAGAAAVREADGIHYATVEGQRVWLGEPGRMAKVARIRIPEDQKTAVQFLQDQGMRVWVMATAEAGLVGVLGIQVAAREDVRRAAQALHMHVLPVLSESSRRALGEAAHLPVRAGSVRPEDATLLRLEADSPEAGLKLRVLELEEGVPTTEGQSARIFAFALPGLPRLVRRIRSRRTQARLWSSAVGALMLAGSVLMAWTLGFRPGWVAGAGLAAWLAAWAVPARQPERIRPDQPGA